MKTRNWKSLKNLPQVVELFVCPQPPTRTRTQGIYM
jgi:hypothetical protein